MARLWVIINTTLGVIRNYALDDIAGSIRRFHEPGVPVCCGQPILLEAKGDTDALVGNIFFGRLCSAPVRDGHARHQL